ncbi:MAG: hypothetical protein JNK05_02640 [Myxococcales bacterium]|nr:hypothetical protein [Myxococcales bacterium]
MLVDRPHFAADYFGPATMLSLHSRLSITDAEFMCVLPAFVDATKRCARVHSLVFSDGGAPSLSQRRRLFDALGDHRRVVRNAVVTDAPSVRFVIGAMSLVVETIQVFAPDQVAEAMNYLGYSIRERRDALDQLALVAKKIPVGRFFAFDRAAERLALPR